MRNAGIVLQNIGLAPAICEKADDKVDGKPGSHDNGLTGENIRVERDAGMVLYFGSSWVSC